MSLQARSIYLLSLFNVFNILQFRPLSVKIATVCYKIICAQEIVKEYSVLNHQGHNPLCATNRSLLIRTMKLSYVIVRSILIKSVQTMLPLFVTPKLRHGGRLSERSSRSSFIFISKFCGLIFLPHTSVTIIICM